MIGNNLISEINNEYLSEVENMPKDTFTSIVLFIYKHELNIDAYKYADGRGLCFKILTGSGEDISDSNQVILTNKDDYIPENLSESDLIISKFINKQINNDSESDIFKVYIDEDNWRTVIYEKSEYISFNNSVFEKIFIALLPKLMPWYFGDASNDLKRKISNIILSDNPYNGLMEYYEEIVTENNIANKVMIKSLEKMGEMITDRRLTVLKQSLSDKEHRYKEYYQLLGRLNMEIIELRSQLNNTGLIAKEYQSPIDEIVQTLKTTREDINLISVYSNDVSASFEINTVLNQIDEDDFNSVVGNNHSYLMSNYCGRCSDSDKEKIFRELFFNEDYKIHVSARVRIWFNDNSLDAFMIPEDELRAHHIRHPHIGADSFTCFGNAAHTITQYILDFRYTEAITQIIYVAKQFTVTDEAAGGVLLREIESKDCIELPDGEYVDFDGFIKYLKDKGEIGND